MSYSKVDEGEKSFPHSVKASRHSELLYWNAVTMANPTVSRSSILQLWVHRVLVMMIGLAQLLVSCQCLFCRALSLQGLLKLFLSDVPTLVAAVLTRMVTQLVRIVASGSLLMASSSTYLNITFAEINNRDIVSCLFLVNVVMLAFVSL